MEEHKIITGMLLVALVVSVAGSMMVMDRMGGLSQNGISGAATGTSDLNITEDITIVLPDSAINFGAGKVDPGSDYASLNSLTGFVTGGNWANQSDNITIRNDGNVGVNVTVQFNRNSGKNGTSFMCTSDAGNCGEGLTDSSPGAGLSFAYRTANKETGACSTGIVSSFTEISEADVELQACGCLKPTSSEDELNLAMQVGVPADASGDKDSTITFTSYSKSSLC